MQAPIRSSGSAVDLKGCFSYEQTLVLIVFKVFAAPLCLAHPKPGQRLQRKARRRRDDCLSNKFGFGSSLLILPVTITNHGSCCKE
eukprot:665219-Rhodomonas_salina.1